MRQNKTANWPTLCVRATVKDEEEVRWSHGRFTRTSVCVMVRAVVMAMCVHVAPALVRLCFNKEIESA